MSRPRTRGRRLLGAGLALGVGVAIALALLRVAAPPAGPVDVPFDRVACAHCRMLVSDPRFAAQLHDAAGRVLFFDDPGCLLLYEAERDGEARRVWFHDSRAERWLDRSEVAFVRVPETPMAYGLAAVDAAAGALTPAQARALIEAGGSAPR